MAPQSCYYYSVENGGFEASPERTPGTYSKYNSIDDRIDDFHYYTTGIKLALEGLRMMLLKRFVLEI